MDTNFYGYTVLENVRLHQNYYVSLCVRTRYLVSNLLIPSLWSCIRFSDLFINYSLFNYIFYIFDSVKWLIQKHWKTQETLLVVNLHLAYLIWLIWFCWRPKVNLQTNFGALIIFFDSKLKYCQSFLMKMVIDSSVEKFLLNIIKWHF